MLVIKSHKIQLLPNNRQKSTFVSWCGTARWAYNYGLERKKAEYEATGKSPGAYSLMKEVVVLKRTDAYAWLCDVSKSVPRMALLNLETAFKNFFRRVKKGNDKVGYPRFKSRHRSKKVFQLELDAVRTKSKRIRLPKIGWVRMSQPLRFDGKLVGAVTISERAGKWYVSLTVEVEISDLVEKQDEVGVDLGVKSLAVLSNGKHFENPKALRRYTKLLARAQRQLARKQNGSKRRKKALLRVRRIHKRIADIRADATHKATRHIADHYGFVAIEDLNVSGMMKNHRLAGAVGDANFYEFRRQVGYKIAWVNGTVAVIDRWFPSSRLCRACGCINSELQLSDRVWSCVCGTVHDRDSNAAKNILAKALLDHRGLPVAGRGGLEAVSSPMKRQQSTVLSL